MLLKIILIIMLLIIVIIMLMIIVIIMQSIIIQVIIIIIIIIIIKIKINVRKWERKNNEISDWILNLILSFNVKGEGEGVGGRKISNCPLEIHEKPHPFLSIENV